MDRISKIKVLKNLKANSGSHSPSPKEIELALGYNPIEHDFCFLSNPYATNLVISKFVNMSKKDWFDILEAYPANSDYVARHISKFEQLDSKYMVIGNGAIQAIDWVCEGWGINNLLIPLPTFSTYYELLPGKHKFTPKFWLNGKCVNDLLNAAVSENCDSILIINPNNPTGESICIEDLKSLVANKNGIKVIIDESFYHFMNDEENYKEFRSWCLNYKNVAFIKSMSKDFGVAGLRLGYLYTMDLNLLVFARSKTTWNLNNLAVTFSELLNQDEFINKYNSALERYKYDRDNFYEKLSSIPSWQVYPSQSNFFLIKLNGTKDADMVYKLLVDYGIYIRTMEDKIGLDSSYIRVASRTASENELFVTAINKFYENETNCI